LIIPGTTNRTILDILYVEEMKTVLVSSFSGEVWAFYHILTEDGLRLQRKIELSDGSPCYHLVKVREGGRKGGRAGGEGRGREMGRVWEGKGEGI
jgi:hypothetical protein